MLTLTTLQLVARVHREVVQAPPDGVRWLADDESGLERASEVNAELVGPEGTPY
jgi:hypothetical protein